MRRKQWGVRPVMLVIGICFFILGAYLVHDLIIKFLKFSIGMFLIILSLPLIFGSKFWNRSRRVRVVKTVRRNE